MCIRDRDDRLFTVLENTGNTRGKLVYADQEASYIRQHSAPFKAQPGYFNAVSYTHLPVFFFKSTEKAGVIFKTILWKNTADRFAGEDRLAAGMKPLF